MTDNGSESYGWNPEMTVSLFDKLKIDLKTSMKIRDSEAKDAIRLIMSEYPRLTVPITLESGKKTSRPKKAEEITNEEIIDIIRGLIKSEKTVLEATGATHSRYMDILKNYLPKMVDSQEIEAWIHDNIDLSTFKSPMQAMRPIMEHFGKQADGSKVKTILQSLSKVK